MPAREYLTTESQREKATRYYYANRERLLAGYKSLPQEIKERRKASTRAWRSQNKERKKAYDRQWRIEHPDEWRALQRLQKNKPEARMLSNLRKRLREFFRQKKGRSSVLFGCTPIALRAHISALFSEGMSWENYGTWHVDHIQPCCSFDLTDTAQRHACFNWSNLRPLWAKENIEKGGRWHKEPPNVSPIASS